MLLNVPGRKGGDHEIAEKQKGEKREAGNWIEKNITGEQRTKRGSRTQK